MGGFQMNITKAPWQVSIHGPDIMCGGSIIGDHWVLTAANCLRFMHDPTTIFIRMGSNYKDKEGKKFTLDQIIQHPKYQGATSDYDFGLLRTVESIPFGSEIQPIKLPNIGSVPNDVVYLISGWGATMNPNQSNERLRGAYVRIVDHGLCNESYGSRITPRMFCAGDYEHGGKDGIYEFGFFLFD